MTKHPVSNEFTLIVTDVKENVQKTENELKKNVTGRVN